MKISFDQQKRDKCYEERGIAFEDAVNVFKGVTIEFEDTRFDYGETRIICFGYLQGRLVVIGYVVRGDTRHIFSMRKANERERNKIEPKFKV